MFVDVAQKKPHDQPECIRMSHAKCGSDLLKTVSEHTQQRTDTQRQTDSHAEQGLRNGPASVRFIRPPHATAASLLPWAAVMGKSQIKSFTQVYNLSGTGFKSSM